LAQAINFGEWEQNYSLPSRSHEFWWENNLGTVYLKDQGKTGSGWNWFKIVSNDGF
jgi:hypothetical protein